MRIVEVYHEVILTEVYGENCGGLPRRYSH